jgi:serine/threonine-protein kinase RsbW
VPHEPGSVGRARAALVSELNGSPTVTSECRDNAALVLSELLGNAIRHAQPLDDGGVLVSWQVTERAVRISVSGGRGPTEPRVVNAPVNARSGRGLLIVQALVERWWRDVDGRVATVHAVLPC